MYREDSYDFSAYQEDQYLNSVHTHKKPAQDFDACLEWSEYEFSACSKRAADYFSARTERKVPTY
jgi:hypothetical protein